MSPNNGILFDGVLRPKLLNNPFVSCYFINFDFLLKHTRHFNNTIFCFCFLGGIFPSNSMSVSFIYNGLCLIYE